MMIPGTAHTDTHTRTPTASRACVVRVVRAPRSSCLGHGLVSAVVIDAVVVVVADESF